MAKWSINDSFTGKTLARATANSADDAIKLYRDKHPGTADNALTVVEYKPLPIHSSVTLERIMDMVQRDDNEGICLACGEDASGVEPDARGYTCESCDEKRVYGASELLIMLA